MKSTAIWRSSVLGVALYVGLCSIWLIWSILTFRYPEVGSGVGSEEVAPLIDSRTYVGLLVVNCLWALYLLRDVLSAKKSPPELRRGHLIGGLLGIVAIAGLQLVFHTAHGAY